MYLLIEYRIFYVFKLYKNVEVFIIWFVLFMSYRIFFNFMLNIKFGFIFVLMCVYFCFVFFLYNYKIVFVIWN